MKLLSSIRYGETLHREGDAGHDLEPVLPANEPSMLLFVGRSSDSSETRRKSEEAIDAFRNFALHYKTSHGIGQPNDNLFDTYQVSKACMCIIVWSCLHNRKGLQDSSLYDITLAMDRDEQLLEALAAGSKIPSVVIVDPESSCLT
ncbi:hypothetical protein Vadar_028886 [Vaccinium darrowii]|uniref:Uncharacterized protein n=1 Tax=Vaccinium darrowii TaxID=229202 RepID=A0ACB7XL02_9ERIC|nr:hypothetical protein Vadar_028886 [Vaccinium darrowii]